MKKVSILAIKYIVYGVMVAISIVPFYILFYLSVNSPSRSYFESMNLLPDWQFYNYMEAWKQSNIGLSIFNSIVITVGALVLLVLLASAAGYSIARFPNVFNRTVFIVLLLCMMIPAIIVTVPLYTLMKDIGGINSRWAMTLLQTSTMLPFAVFLYTSFIKSIPKEIEESAIIDGCTHFTAFWRVTFHFLKPVNSSVVILAGMRIWNNYDQAIFFLQDSSVRTIPLAVSAFFQKYGADWNLMAAASMIGLLPAVLLFLFFQKSFVKGITTGAIKG
ncbi:carbohydrate ABC transporter permease [Gracilibacillus sp. YIM 98692]|uniref:carbohydrate ABC transporter permease n=1 Tax=Gracilibacillus sp. YIM 98692 TaxID=2663532 RepID=UPI0013D095B9|nr:carbohydrate ABC transporter permease [Gracilibacillus sp. YIM 98692]